MIKWIESIGKDYNISVGIIIIVFLLISLFINGWKKRRWPKEEIIIQLIAFGGAIYMSGKFLVAALKMTDADSQIVNLTGCLLIGYGAIKGIVRAFSSDPIYDGKKEDILE